MGKGFDYSKADLVEGILQEVWELSNEPDNLWKPLGVENGVTISKKKI